MRCSRSHWCGKECSAEKYRVEEESTHLSTRSRDLSLQYLQNSTILTTLNSWGINLGIFYKFLWRHICTLELIRLRYHTVHDAPKGIWDRIRRTLYSQRQQSQTREAAEKYLTEYSEQYWITADTQIRMITEELGERISSDDKISAAIVPVGLSVNGTREESSSRKVEKDVQHRAQRIVNDQLLSKLNNVIRLLKEHSFSDSQTQYYIVIDDLDRNWMPDQKMYMELLHALISQVTDLNRMLDTAKIVIALRANILHRLVKYTGVQGEQREKWRDIIVHVTWTPEDLKGLVNLRLQTLLRGQYTSNAPSVDDVLPRAQKERRQQKESGFQYLLSRTMCRPRDVFDFINRVFEHNGTAPFSRLSWSTFASIETRYSEGRANAL